MSIAKTLLGSAVLVPETGETGWGDEMTGIVVDLIDIANISAQQLSSGSLVQVLPSTSATPAAGGTVTPTSSYMRLSGSGGPVQLSTVTPIAAGQFNGQKLELEGTDNVNTVTIRDSGNANLNGLIVLADGVWIDLRWNSTAGQWRERNRSN